MWIGAAKLTTIGVVGQQSDFSQFNDLGVDHRADVGRNWTPIHRPQPYEADKARGVINRMTIELEWQRRYCELLGNAVAADGHLAKNGSHVI
jgi:hypothetical protein